MSRKKKRRSNRSQSAKRSRFERVKAGFDKRQQVWVFVIIFFLLIILFYQLTSLSPFYKEQFFPAYLDWNAQISGLILKALGQEITVAGEVISSSAFSISIKRGCEAIEPSALFVAAVLAFPVPFLSKLPGIVVGTCFLLAFNFVRIISLFFIGIYLPDMFHMAHVDLWPALFILLAIVCWALWIQWATNRRRASYTPPLESEKLP